MSQSQNDIFSVSKVTIHMSDISAENSKILVDVSIGGLTLGR